MNSLKEHQRRTGAAENSGEDSSPTDRDLIEQYVEMIVIQKGALEIALARSNPDPTPLLLPWSPVPPVRRREIIVPPRASDIAQRPIRSETRVRLVEGIAKVRPWLDELVSGNISGTREIAQREGCSDRSIRMTLSLAFLSPGIVQAAVDGTLPDGPGVSRLTELPPAWPKQAKSITTIT